MSGRFAPSPTGRLHVGNLRTALLAWLAARSSGLDFIVRIEDLDRVQSAPEHVAAQLADLAAIGVEWTTPVVHQSERFGLYRDALATLRARDLVYECYCSRREVRQEIENSPHAPHLPPGSYPGTCRTLTAGQRRRRLDHGRRPALRLRARESMAMTDGSQDVIEFVDLVAGPSGGGVDDVVLQRNDGVPAYNLAVVVDDAVQGVAQVVRGGDLLASTPRQILLQRLLGFPTPTYAHVPLVFGDDGERLAKRHGAVTLDELRADGADPEAVVGELLASCGVRFETQSDDDRQLDMEASAGASRARVASAVDGFEVARIDRDPLVYVSEPAAAARFRLVKSQETTGFSG